MIMELPAEWGTGWDVIPLVSDQELRKVPDRDTRAAIKELATINACRKDPAFREILRLRDICQRHITETTSSAAVLEMPSREVDAELFGWRQLEGLCAIVMTQHMATARAKIDDEYLLGLLSRWLRLRLQAIETVESNHTIDGFHVEHGIVRPKTGSILPARRLG